MTISEMDIISFNMPCYLKAAISVSGVGIYRCANREELRDAMKKFEPGVPVQLQEEIITDVFLNMQYRVVDDRLVRLAASEQILEGCAHQGNRFPSSHEPWEAIDPMAFWLKERGMKGIFAFDLAVVETPDGMRFPAIECNPRFNGASYPTVIAQKLDIPEWSAMTFKTKYRKLVRSGYQRSRVRHEDRRRACYCQLGNPAEGQTCAVAGRVSRLPGSAA